MPTNSNEIINKAIVIIILILMLSLLAKSIIRIAKARKSPIITVQGRLVTKHKQEVLSQYSGSGKKYKYVVVFSVEGKKKSFYVSEFSYASYRPGESGTLRYKGDRIIDFS